MVVYPLSAIVLAALLYLAQKIFTSRIRPDHLKINGGWDAGSASDKSSFNYFCFFNKQDYR